MTFEHSQQHGSPHHFLAQLAGDWKGTSKLWLEPDKLTDESPVVGVVQLLRAHNIYHEVIVFPDDVHVALLFQHLLTAFNAADDFFNRFLGKESSRN